MKKLQKYILKNIARALIPAFATLTLIMAAGFCMQLLNQGLDVVRLHGLVPPVFAYCIPMVLPSAFLTAVIMTFGRLSADNELIAVRAGGIHLFRLIYPVLIAAAGLSLVVAAFQFETVPRARARIKALQYQALKQILLDKVALSARKQLSFPPAYVQYEEVKDGVMLGLVVVEMRNNRLRTIITAESGVIKEDPEESGWVVFEMKNSVVTRGLQPDAEAMTVSGDEVSMPFRAHPDPSRVLRHKKHLPLIDLLRELQELRERVASQPRVHDPDLVRKEQYVKRHNIQVDMRALNGTLEKTQEKYEKYAVHGPRRQAQLVERNQRLTADAQQEVESLQQDQAACTKELQEVRQQDLESIERQVELEKKQRELLAKIDAKKKEIEELKQELAEADKVALTSDRSAAELAEEIRELQQGKNGKMQRLEEVNEKIRWAGDQDELKSITIRIHKRLVQSVTVLVFAMVGIPVGILASRRRVVTAFGISFAIVLLVFYPLLIVGQLVADARLLPIAPAMWAGNGLTFLIGACLMVKVVRR